MSKRYVLTHPGLHLPYRGALLKGTTSESAASLEEGVVARARQLAEVGWTAADILKGYRKVDGKVVKMVHRADTPERRRMSDALVRHA